MIDKDDNQYILLTANGGMFVTTNPKDLLKVLEMEIKQQSTKLVDYDHQGDCV
jgi:hypothetical protein